MKRMIATTILLLTVATSVSALYSNALGTTKRSTSMQMNLNGDKVPISPTDATSRSIQRMLKVATVTSILGVSSLPFVAYADDSNFKTTDSGLKYRDIKIGDGAAPIPGDGVRVHYTGWLEDFESEKKFDSSYDRGKPLAFKVGVKQVISGWDEGLLTDMKVGGKRELIIPPELGYGSRGAGGVIPPNATLYFKVELVGIGAKANR